MKDRDIKALTPAKKGLPVPWGPSRRMVSGAAIATSAGHRTVRTEPQQTPAGGRLLGLWGG